MGRSRCAWVEAVRPQASPVYLRRRVTALAVLAAGGAGLALLVVGGGHHGAKRLAPAAGPSSTTRDPIAYDPARRAAFERSAAAGLAHVLYAKSPGGIVATARRVAAFRPLLERAGWDADTLEAIVFVESAGRPDAQAGSDPSAAAGLTQIVAETGRDLLGMHIDLARTRRLERGIGRGHRVAARERELRRVDQRFDPAAAIAATVRYLRFARAKLGRDDLAVASYHMGVGNLQSVLRAYGASAPLPYAQLYFDSSPLRHAAAWQRLAAFGDDSSTYLWRIGAAKQIMRLYRTRPGELRRLAALQLRKSSSEEVMHPQASTATFATPDALAAAFLGRELVPLPAARLRADGIAIDRGMGSLAARLGQRPSLYRGLRPRALAALEVLGAGTQVIAHTGPLVVTSTVRDLHYQRLLARSDPEATHHYSLHATGWAFDIARVYRSRAQALAFQFMLDRLTALGWIAWLREPAVIHVTVAARPPA
jgi:hypothetical protein